MTGGFSVVAVATFSTECVPKAFHMVLLALSGALKGVAVMKQVQTVMRSFCFVLDGNGSDLGKPKLNLSIS